MHTHTHTRRCARDKGFVLSELLKKFFFFFCKSCSSEPKTVYHVDVYRNKFHLDIFAKKKKENQKLFRKKKSIKKNRTKNFLPREFQVYTILVRRIDWRAHKARRIEDDIFFWNRVINTKLAVILLRKNVVVYTVVQ